MSDERSALLNLLRCELDATNQQFTHILALRVWGKQEAAQRITEIDNLDFANGTRRTGWRPTPPGLPAVPR
jgi:hypothetical protein